jgi:predicted transcriptional regulator
MKIFEIIQITEAKLISQDTNLENEVDRAFASDLMSDVLTLDTEGILLITGLMNLQTIRTAEMAEIKNIMIVRNKKPSEEMINLARKEDITLMISEKSMFHISGLLFQAGLKPVY